MRFPRLPKKTEVMKAVFLTRDSKIGKSSFLTSKFHAEMAVQFADLSEKDHVCELGAGFGVLSEEILRKRVRSLLSVEWNPLCIEHLSRFKKYHSNHIVKHGDPFFFHYDEECNHVLKDKDSVLTVFVNFPLYERNYHYIELMLEDLVLSKQAFSYPSTKIITFMEIKRAHRMSSTNALIPGKTYELIVQNYFKTELGPKVPRKSFTNTTVSDCCIIKLVPLPRPIIDIEFSRLCHLIYCLSGGSPHGIKNKTIEHNLRYCGVLHSENEERFYASCKENGLNLKKVQKNLNFVDIMKFSNIVHLFPEEKQDLHVDNTS